MAYEEVGHTKCAASLDKLVIPPVNETDAVEHLVALSHKTIAQEVYVLSSAMVVASVAAITLGFYGIRTLRDALCARGVDTDIACELDAKSRAGSLNSSVSEGSLESLEA